MLKLTRSIPGLFAFSLVVLAGCHGYKDTGIATVVVDKNHSAVTALTNRSVILVKGEVVFDGPSEQVRQDPALIRKHLGV